MSMTRYIVSIPAPWASFRFDCKYREEAIKFFQRSAEGHPFASLYKSNRENLVAFIADGKLRYPR